MTHTHGLASHDASPLIDFPEVGELLSWRELQRIAFRHVRGSVRLDAFGQRIRIADFLHPLHPYLGDLQGETGGPAGHVDRRPPLQRLSIFGRGVPSGRVLGGIARRGAIVDPSLAAMVTIVDSAPCFSHPQPVSHFVAAIQPLDDLVRPEALRRRDFGLEIRLHLGAVDPCIVEAELRRFVVADAVPVGDDPSRLYLAVLEDGADHLAREQDPALPHTASERLVQFSPFQMALTVEGCTHARCAISLAEMPRSFRLRIVLAAA